jgi:hypothetical protein
MYPDMVPINSSNLEMVGYLEDHQQLFVQFLGGGLYVYERVPRSTYDELMNAPSAGRYLNTEIKPNYPFARVS